MDARAAAADYVSRMVRGVGGVKALLLDAETARVVGVVASQGDLFLRDVCLTERLGSRHDAPLRHLSAIVFVRPTAENVRALRGELRAPAFGAYHIVFSNIARPTFLEEIADADETHAVVQVQEYFADFYALDRNLLSFNVSPCLDAVLGAGRGVGNPQFERTVEGVVATLLALKRRPVVRFQGSSSLCRNLSERVVVRMDQEAELFGFRAQDPPPLLLILDRCEDPVTPLLNQWTYEAMLHELLGAENNRVSLKHAPNVPDDLKEVVLDASTDDFFRRNRYENFGELGVNLKKLVDSFHKQSKTRTADLSSIEDMMRFVGSYPEFRKTMSKVSKHVALSSELSRLVEKNDLLAVSQLEQDLACREAEGEHRRQVLEMLANAKVSQSDKLRLVMLYSLRYEEAPTIRKSLGAMVDALHKAGVGSDGVHLLSALKDYAGSRKRSGDVFRNRTFFAMASNTVRRGIGGVDNVYTQHEPLLSSTLDDLLRGRLKSDMYPCARGIDGVGGNRLLDARPITPRNGQNGVKQPATPVPIPREVIVVIAGGATYEEAKCVSGINGGPHAFRPPDGSVTASATLAARQVGAKFTLVGTNITNSTLFAVQVARHAAAVSAAASRRDEHVF